MVELGGSCGGATEAEEFCWLGVGVLDVGNVRSNLRKV